MFSLAASPPGTMRVLRALGMILLYTKFYHLLARKKKKNHKVKVRKSYG